MRSWTCFRVTLADVHAALTYYFDNHSEIEAEFSKEDEWDEWALHKKAVLHKKSAGCTKSQGKPSTDN